MLQHFAITPDVFDPATLQEMSPQGCLLLTLLQKITDGGLLANLHAGQWWKEAIEHHDYQELSMQLQDELRVQLSLLSDRNRLVKHPTGSVEFEQDDFRWLKWALERNQTERSKSIDCVIATDDLIELSKLNENVLLALNKTAYHSSLKQPIRTIEIAKTRSNLVKHLTPICRYAQKVTLIDPYMNCYEPRWMTTIQIVADLLGKNDGHHAAGTVHIHAGNPQKAKASWGENIEDRLDSWETKLKGMARPGGHTYRVFLWGSKPRGPVFHDRYVITDQCGLTIGAGLDCYDDKKSEQAVRTSLALMTYDDSRNILTNQFHKSKSPYNFLGKRLIEP